MKYISAMAVYKSITQPLIVIIFIAVILTPLLRTLFYHETNISKSEKRELTPFPNVKMSISSMKDFASGFELYYNDHFGFRNQLIHIHNFIMVKYLKQSPIEKVIVGENNWFFYKVDGLKMLEDFRGVAPFNDFQLQQWKHTLENRRSWLLNQGIRYLFVVAPNKQSIYPENMPKRYNKVFNKTRFDQLMEYFKRNSDFQIIDLREQLIEAKKEDIIYYITDSHWNSKGALVAYEAILDKVSNLFPDVNKKEYSAFKFVRKDMAGRDLVNMLDLSDIYIEKSFPYIILKTPCAKTFKKKINIGQTPYKMIRQPIIMGCSKAKLRAIFFGDSFSTALTRYLPEHFKEIVFIYHPFNQEIAEKLIKEFRPDIIIEEVVERRLSEVPGK